MKSNKTTTVLFNLVLILVGLLLAKYLLVIPGGLWADSEVKYAVMTEVQTHELQQVIEYYAKEGWRLHSFGLGGSGKQIVVFEK